MISYQQGPEGQGVEDEVIINDGPEQGEGDDRTELENMLAQTSHLGDRMDATILAEGERDIEGLSTDDVEVSDYLISTPEEETAAREFLALELGEGEEVSDEQIREYILSERLAALDTNQITDGDREVLEGALIGEIAEEMGIDPETMRTLRALGFDGAQDWTLEETAENLRAMAQSISDIQAEMEARGIPVPEDRDEFLAMYDYLMQTDDIEGPLTEDDITALGIRTEIGPEGEIRIDPTTPGYREMPNGTVMGPPGAPYSSGGDVYAGRPNEISPDAGNITYDSLTTFNGGAEMTEAEAAQLTGSPEQKERNQELIEARFPSQWYNVAIEFCNTEGNIAPDKPIALASCPNLVAIVSYPGEPPRIEETPISIGRNGYGPSVVADHDPGSGGTGDRRTQTGRVQHFNAVSIAGAGNVVRGGGSMTGAIIESPEGRDRGGRWWHGGRDGRFPGQNSHGCIVATDEFMIRLAEAVNRHGGGYGFQSEQALGEVREPEPSGEDTETPVA